MKPSSEGASPQFRSRIDNRCDGKRPRRAPDSAPALARQSPYAHLHQLLWGICSIYSQWLTNYGVLLACELVVKFVSSRPAIRVFAAVLLQLEPEDPLLSAKEQVRCGAGERT